MMDSVQYQAWLVGFKDVVLSRMGQFPDQSTIEGRRALRKMFVKSMRQFCALTIPTHPRRSLFDVKINPKNNTITITAVQPPDTNVELLPMVLQLVPQTQATPIRLLEIFASQIGERVMAAAQESQTPLTLRSFKLGVLRSARKFYALVSGRRPSQFKIRAKHSKATGKVTLVVLEPEDEARRAWTAVLEVVMGQIPVAPRAPRVKKQKAVAEVAETTSAPAAPVLSTHTAGNPVPIVPEPPLA
jgi:hypothetical protein